MKALGSSQEHRFGADLAPGERRLAEYAADPCHSLGRLHPEPPCPMRNDFQRDRDRIVHASAFRRLTYKTQVFVYHEGDHYRTRLTHSLEVAQIARAMARQLMLNEDLAEALALAHDLGHPPFGHAGERALDAVMRDYGGFDHNAQSLRLVTSLERKYAEFDGLNLTWETLEGLVKHNGPLTGRHAAGEGEPRPLPASIVAYDARHDLALHQFAAAEAQVAALADDIAYNTHDIDDGLRAGLIAIEDLKALALPGRFVREALARHPSLPAAQLMYEVTRRLITVMVADAVAEARRRLARLSPASAQEIRQAEEPVVAFSDALASQLAELRRFLFARVYRHPRVMNVMRDAERVVAELFSRYLADHLALPEAWQARCVGLGASERALVIADFVAGMTDRFAIGEHRRLFDATPDLR
ncbi:MAG: deoxyguanosinetriphosphate triphosphohydrolase [Hyphomicrobiaceae bacterium]